MRINIEGTIVGAKFDTYPGLSENHNTLYIILDGGSWHGGPCITITNVDPTMGRRLAQLIEEANGREPTSPPSPVGGPEPKEQQPGDDEIPF